MPSPERVLFSLQMAEESLREAHLLLKDQKIRSLMNSLYNAFYYGIEAFLFNQDIHCRSHSDLKKSFIEKIIQERDFPKKWEGEVESIFEAKMANENGYLFQPEEVQRFMKSAEEFLREVKRIIPVGLS